MKTPSQKSSAWPWIVGIVVVALILLIGGSALSGPRSDSNDSTTTDINKKSASRKLALICTKDMFTKFHIHPHLTIIINGTEQEIPANIGVKPACMNSLHTHDGGGEIHVEAPRQEDFLLSDFFAVWGKTFNQNQILDAVADDAHQIVMTVNGEVSDQYENLLLQDLDKIVIEYKAK